MELEELGRTQCWIGGISDTPRCILMNIFLHAWCIVYAMTFVSPNRHSLSYHVIKATTRLDASRDCMENVSRRRREKCAAAIIISTTALWPECRACARPEGHQIVSTEIKSSPDKV